MGFALHIDFVCPNYYVYKKNTRESEIFTKIKLSNDVDAIISWMNEWFILIHFIQELPCIVLMILTKIF